MMRVKIVGTAPACQVAGRGARSRARPASATPVPTPSAMATSVRANGRLQPARDPRVGQHRQVGEAPGDRGEQPGDRDERRGRVHRPAAQPRRTPPPTPRPRRSTAGSRRPARPRTRWSTASSPRGARTRRRRAARARPAARVAGRGGCHRGRRARARRRGATRARRRGRVPPHRARDRGARHGRAVDPQRNPPAVDHVGSTRVAPDRRGGGTAHPVRAVVVPPCGGPGRHPYPTGRADRPGVRGPRGHAGPVEGDGG